MASTLPLYPASIDALLAQTPGRGRVKASWGKRNPAKPAPKAPKQKAAAPAVTLTPQNNLVAPYFQAANALERGMGNPPVNPADIPLGMTGPTMRSLAVEANVKARKAVPPELELQMTQLKARLKELQGVREQLELAPPTADEPYSIPAPVERPEMAYPERPQPQINPMASALAAIAGMADPQMAGQYAATVNQAAEQAASTAYQDRITQFQNDFEQKTRAYEDESARRLERIRNDLSNRELARDDRKVKTEYERLKGHLNAQAQAIQAELEGTSDFSAKMQAAAGLQAEADRMQGMVGAQDATYNATVDAYNKKLDRLQQILLPQLGQEFRQQSEQTFKKAQQEDTQQHQLTMQQNTLAAAWARQNATIQGANYRAGLAVQKKAAEGKPTSASEKTALQSHYNAAMKNLQQVQKDYMKAYNEYMISEGAGKDMPKNLRKGWEDLIQQANQDVINARNAILGLKGGSPLPEPIDSIKIGGRTFQFSK